MFQQQPIAQLPARDLRGNPHIIIIRETRKNLETGNVRQLEFEIQAVADDEPALLFAFGERTLVRLG